MSVTIVNNAAPVTIVPAARGVILVNQIPGTGPQGVPGGGFNYVHTQNSASATWTITHNLGGFPNVTLVDSSGVMFEGDWVYLDANRIRVDLGVPQDGKAYLS